ncbi:efflux RND transporter periplasmic adaptor subunit [Novosphingobium naphthalenivorans]|uniref:efflux RND transporter periplasmic adaptor subunit n=1 Tax=Novosphingobium naphthalenivorans TaxID=273168 RepID=UPI00082D9102|nr:efflux RND transporter periplasmic adaptor subunit [Novosphingobium naphthalenivorans]
MNDKHPAGNLSLNRPVARQREVSPALYGLVAALAAIVLAMLAWRYVWPHEVGIYTVRRGIYEQTLSGPAVLDAINKADVSSRISGRVTRILADRNDVVAAGQVVAVIEQDDLLGKVSASRAGMVAAQDAQREASANLASAQATLANARASFDRQAKLRRDGWVSGSSYDQAQASLREGEARVAAMRSSISQAQAQTKAAAAGLRADEAQLAMATVRAPFGGVVAVRNRNVGDVLTAGSAIMEIVDPASIVITARFDESAIGAIHAGQAARIRFPSAQDRPLAGHVLRLGREVDPETREFTVDIVADRLPADWALSQRATVEVLLSVRPDTLVIPVSFVIPGKDRAAVWVLNGGRARRRTVELSGSGPKRAVRKGLKPGDVLVLPQDAYALMPVARQNGGVS